MVAWVPSLLKSRIEILSRNALHGPEGERSTEPAIELDAAQGGDEGPDGEDAREGSRHGDGELLDILIQQFIITVFVKIIFLKRSQHKIKFFLRKPLSSLPRAKS